jgi:hypothetical protein
MLFTLIVTLVVVNLGAIALLYLQHRQAAREREAAARLAVEIYTAADGALKQSDALLETLRAASAQFQQDRLILLEGLRTLAGVSAAIGALGDGGPTTPRS